MQPDSPDAGPPEAAEESDIPQVSVSATPLTGKPFRLSVQARDQFGNPVYLGGANVDVRVIEPPIEAGSEADHMLAPKLECNVRDNDTGKYFIDLTCANPGMHTVTVRLGGEELIGSPMHFVAAKPRVLASMKAVGKSRGETLFACASALSNADILWGFRNWLDAWEERREKLDILRTVAIMVLYADQRFCLHLWQENAESRKYLRGTLNRALIAVRAQWARRAFNTWEGYAQDRGRNYALLLRVVGAIKNHQINLGFSTWFANLYPEKSKDALGVDIDSNRSDEVRSGRVSVRQAIVSANWDLDDDDEE